MNPYLMEVLLQERRREMLAEAERLRLIAEHDSNRPQMREKALKKLGEWLIATGEKLIHRYDHKSEIPAS